MVGQRRRMQGFRAVETEDSPDAVADCESDRDCEVGFNQKLTFPGSGDKSVGIGDGNIPGPDVSSRNSSSPLAAAPRGTNRNGPPSLPLKNFAGF
jgi:hypothetical protein